MRIYIIRHAEPDYANNTITPAGHLEAKALADKLASEGLTHIVSSPLGRALHTMQYTADVTGIQPEVEEWTKELNGWRISSEAIGSMPAWNLHGEIIRQETPVPSTTNWHQQPYFDNPEFLAMFKQLQDNSDRFMKKHGYERAGGRYKNVSPNKHRIAVFCHHGFGLAWLSHLLELPLSLVWSGFWLAPSSVTTLIMDERSAAWSTPRCIGLGDVSHLHAAGLPVSTMGLVANSD